MRNEARPREKAVSTSVEKPTVSLRTSVLAFSFLVSACASTSPARAVLDTRAAVLERTGEEIVWKADSRLERDADRATDTLLRGDLTLERAVKIALLHSPSVQMDLEELGIAQADLVQSGLLRNPSFGGSIRLPVDGAPSPIVEADLLTSLTDLAFRGTKKDIAARALVGTRYRVTDAIVRHVFETKVAWHGHAAALQVLEMRKVVAESAETSLALTRKQHEAGTIRDLDLANEESLYAQIVLERLRAEGEVSHTREALQRLMGLHGKRTSWTLTSVLPLPPEHEPDLAHVETWAVTHRADLRAAHADVDVLSHAVAFAKTSRFVSNVDGGVAYKSEGGAHFLGPAVSVELPLFDTKAAAIARLEAEERKARRREEGLAIDARSEVRELRARLAVAREVAATYGKKIVPLRERIVALSQEQYDAMLLGVFQLIAAKQQELEAYRSSIEALRDYWILRDELAYRSGGSLPRDSATGGSK